MLRIVSTLVTAVGLLAAIGCEQPRAGAGNLYFDSPKAAVEQIRPMLRARDWVTLARYYDLTDSDIQREALRSGEFFYTDQRPEGGAHPAGFWHYKHPFAPAFDYQEEGNTADPDIRVVVVKVVIDQGGGPPQVGLDQFRMIRHGGKGWQVLPD